MTATDQLIDVLTQGLQPVKPLRKPKTTFAMFEMADKTSNRMEAP